MKDYTISNIEYLLFTHDMTQSDLANILNVSRQTISQWLKGQTTPKHDKISLIASYFGIDEKKIMFEDLKGGTILEVEEPVYFDDQANVPMTYDDVSFILALHDLKLTNSEMQQLLDYAKFLKSKKV